MLLDLDLQVARSINLGASESLTSLESVISSGRYLNTLTWQYSSATSPNSDAIWINTYDLVRLKGSTAVPILTSSRKFELSETVYGFIEASHSPKSVSLCYSDIQSNLILALWLKYNDRYTDNLYTATMDNSLAQKINGCTDIRITE